VCGINVGFQLTAGLVAHLTDETYILTVIQHHLGRR